MTPVELALALAVAQVCVNEASWNSPADCALVYQATESHGRTPEARLDWLERHSHTVFSSCIAGRGNCRWTPGLTWSDAEPEGWPEAAPPWSTYVDRWRRIRELAEALVTGRIRRRPCPRGVVTWGGPMDIDAALRRGLRPLECRGTLNTGFARGAES